MRKRSKTKVAFQGEPGAFSHAAARKLLGPDVDILPCPRFDEVFGALQAKQATHAVIPIENTLHGSVHENYDHLLEYDLPIVGETSIRISHQLIAMPGTRFRDVRRVLSHPVALNQCVRFFKEHPDIEKVPHYDTAGSVKTLADERPPPLRGDRLRRCGGNLWRSHSQARHRGRQAEFHAILSLGSEAVEANVDRRRLEDIRRFLDAQPSRLTVSSDGLFRPA
jgi:hypothetical protein